MKAGSSTKRRNRKGGSAIAEFGPTLWLFFLLFIFPFLDLVSFTSGVASVMLIANWGARQAATCQNFTEAVQSVQKTENDLVAFRHFAAMKPIGGKPSGVQLNVVLTPISGSGGAQKIYSPPPAPNKIPNTANGASPNLSDHIYQYSVTAAYEVSPLLNFNGFPLFNTIPGLGKPVPVSFTSMAQVEHPDGLND